MSSLNQCQFIGNLGRDPEMRYTQDGKAIANFSIACSETWKDKNGEKQERTEWVRLSAFGKLAEIVGEYLKTGSKVYVSGRMQTREYTKDDVKRYSTEIIVDKLVMLSGRRQNDDGPTDKLKEPPPVPSGAGDFEDDIPF